MFILFISFLLRLGDYKDAKGVTLKDGKIYLTGGLKGGYILYQIPLNRGTMSIKLKMKMKNLSGSTIGIYIKNYGDMKSIVLPPILAGKDSSFYLWEGTENDNWTSSRPEFLSLYQGKGLKFKKDGNIEILLYAGGGFFKRGRFIIQEIEIIEAGLSENMIKIIEENGFKIDENMLIYETFFPYQKASNEAQRRALALRGAKVKIEKKIQDLFNIIGLKSPLRMEILDIQYFENGLNVKAGVLLDF